MAGLFFIWGKKKSEATTLLKPSQLDFTNSNQLQEPMAVSGSAQVEAFTAESANNVEPVAVTSLSEPEKKCGPI